MKQVAIDIQPGYKLISNIDVQSKLDGNQVDFSKVWTITGISSDNPTPDNEIYTYEWYPDPNGDPETGTITYSEILANYKVLTPQEFVGLKSGKIPEGWLETLDAYPTSSDEIPPVKTAGFMGIPKIVWFIAIGGLAIYIAKKNKMI